MLMYIYLLCKSWAVTEQKYKSCMHRQRWQTKNIVNNINKGYENKDNRQLTYQLYWCHCWNQLLMQCIWDQQAYQFQMTTKKNSWTIYNKRVFSVRLIFFSKYRRTWHVSANADRTSTYSACLSLSGQKWTNFGAMSTSQMAVMPCHWGVKAGMVRVRF